jgi:hypothetical protein
MSRRVHSRPSRRSRGECAGQVAQQAAPMAGRREGTTRSTPQGMMSAIGIAYPEAESQTVLL